MQGLLRLGIYLIIFFLSHSIQVSESFGQCNPAQDLQTLKDLNDAGWNIGNWDSQPGVLADWDSVKADAGCVRELKADKLNLNIIPDAIKNFSNIKILWLNGNKITGQIPKTIFELTTLTNLYLQDNEFTGAIPAEINNLTELVVFGLDNNDKNPNFQIEDPVPALNNLTKLEKFYARNHVLSDLPANFPTGSLNEIALAGNFFTFEDLLPFADLNNLTQFYYTPQREVQTTTNYTKNEGEALEIDLGIDNGVATNQYKWFKDGNFHIDITGSNKLSFANLTLADAGEYHCEITNTDFQNKVNALGNLTTGKDILTLTTIKITVNVNQVQNTCVTNDKASLLALFNALGGTNWTNNNNWDTGFPLDEWDGITTNTDGCVTKIELENNNLTGTLPKEIGDFENLQTLVLSLNNITGKIPDEISKLLQLKDLYLDRNQLGQTIPTGIGSLTNLEFLHLNQNQLSGPIPTELGNLTNIINFSLWDNNLTGTIPATLATLTKCQYFAIGENSLSGGVPDFLGNLPELLQIFLNDNTDLTGPLPSTLTKLNKLGTLYFDNTDLCSPNNDEFKNWLANVADVDPTDKFCELLCADNDKASLLAFYNALDGDNWTNNENWNSVAPLEDWYGITTNADGCVTKIELEGNNLTGTLPTEIGDFENLQTLVLSLNNITGTIPDEISKLLQLKDLYLDRNQLDQTIPTGIGSLTNLEFLHLNENQLSGPIPTELGNLTNIINFSLWDNNLTGTIPTTLAALTKCQYFAIGFNSLNGGVPNFLGNLPELEEIFLNDNPLLTGPLPITLINLQKLKKFHFNNTDLCIPIDISFTDWLQNIEEVESNDNPCETTCSENDKASLLALYTALDGDNWTNKTNWNTNAPLDEWDGITTNTDGCVIKIELEENNLTGTIPIEIGDFKQLEELNLGKNNISGSIPTQISGLTALKILWLNENNLTGQIPNELFNLTNLINLYLFRNNFEPPLPTQINLLINLEVFGFDYNETGFEEDFPNIPNLAKLEKFFIRDGKFKDLQDISGFPLTHLGLSGNYFTFEDLLPYQPLNLTEFFYSPQEKIGEEETITINSGENLTIDLGIDEQVTTNVYNWFKDGNLYSTVNGSNKLSFTPIAVTDSGTYTCEVTNPLLPDLTLLSFPIKINVTEDPENSPTNLIATSINASTIDLAWEYNSNSPEVTFIIERSEGVHTNFEVVASIGPLTELTYQDIGDLKEGTTYFYRVKAVKNLIESAYSNEAETKTNYRPVVADIEKQTNNQQPVNFTSQDFENSFSDQDLEDQLVSVLINGLPQNGTFSLNQIPVQAGQEILVEDLGQLVYTPQIDFSGNVEIPFNSTDGKDYATQDGKIIITITPTVNIDLIVRNASTTNGEINAGDFVEISASVENIGTESAAPSTFKILLSTDTFPDPSDIELFTHEVPELKSLDSENINNNILIPAETTPGNYFLLFIADANNVITGELDEANNIVPLKIIILPNAEELVIMNVITPNQDGKNDELFIKNIERYPENEVTVLNANGEIVFTQKSYSNDWNATDNSGNTLPFGKYVCLITTKEPSSQTIRRLISIMRDN